MSWYKITLFDSFTANKSVVGTEYVEASSINQAVVMANSFGIHYQIDPITDDEAPIVKRGLLKATTEQLKYELVRRGWKVSLS